MIIINIWPLAILQAPSFSYTIKPESLNQGILGCHKSTLTKAIPTGPFDFGTIAEETWLIKLLNLINHSENATSSILIFWVNHVQYFSFFLQHDFHIYAFNLVVNVYFSPFVLDIYYPLNTHVIKLYLSRGNEKDQEYSCNNTDLMWDAIT